MRRDACCISSESQLQTQIKRKNGQMNTLFINTWRVRAKWIRVLDSLVFLISRVWVFLVLAVIPVLLIKTLYHGTYSRWSCVLCNTLERTLMHLLKREGVCPGLFGFDWHHIAPQHLTNHYMVL